MEQALEAEKGGADYLGSGAVFGIKTKSDANFLEHKVLSEIYEAVSTPVVAIGGISKNNMISLLGLGADGAAVVSEIFSADNIELKCRELRRLAEETFLH